MKLDLRKTQSTAFSIPIKVLLDMSETLSLDGRFKSKSQLITFLISEYINRRKSLTEKLKKVEADEQGVS